MKIVVVGGRGLRSIVLVLASTNAPLTFRCHERGGRDDPCDHRIDHH